MSDKKVTFGRIFWPSLIAALTVSILGTIIWAIVIGSLFSTEPFTVKEKTILHMTLSGDIGEKGETAINPSTLSIDKQIGLTEILHGFAAAKKDPNVEGVFLELDNLNCGMATAKEIRDAINNFEKCGKFVVAYNSGEIVTTKEYYIASAANESYGFPTTNLQFLGLGAELMYFKGLLDDLEIDMQVIRGSDNDFKSAVEPFFRENMSDSARVQTERYITSIWTDIKKGISKDRKISMEELDHIADDALVTNMNDAVKHKLIDGTKYRDQILKILAKKVKLEKGKELELLSFSKYARKRLYQNQILLQEEDNHANIAVILAEGNVTKSGDGLSSDEICELFKEVREDHNIKTVVFRINSPGGSALASDEIWREVQLTNRRKKVIVSMGDLAASGGYYIAAPGTTIFAQPTTITGSIGVFGVIPFTGQMMENKLGLTFDRASTNKHSILTTNRRLTEEEMTMIQEEVDEIYDQFKGRVAQGRGMTKEQVNVVARGRVWTGRDALAIGLVDKLGGLNDAIRYAGKKAGIKEKKVLYYPKVKEDKLGMILEQFEGEAASMKMKQSELPSELMKYYSRIKKLEGYQGMQMRLPFEFIIE